MMRFARGTGGLVTLLCLVLLLCGLACVECIPSPPVPYMRRQAGLEAAQHTCSFLII